VSSAGAREAQVTVIEPQMGVSWPDWRDLWSHRELLLVLARRDVSVRYKQSFIGALWSLVQPLSFAAVFSIFFDLLTDIDTGTDVPYPVFAVLGMVTWLFFTAGLTKVSESTVVSAPLISKVYFPRLVIPLSSVAAPVVDFAVGMVVVLGVTFAYGVVPPVQVVLVPLLVPLVLAVTLGFGLWFSAINVKYRDIGNLVSFIILLGLFISPIIYPFSTVPAEYHLLYGLNPMVGVMELTRWMVLPGADFPTLLIWVPLVESTVLIATGILYFGRAQRGFADVI
jgi:lipopolysaccharide transport system permease protein